MGIAEKLAGAKETKWIAEGLSISEQKTIVELAKISARIERCRLELEMTQEEFAKYMGVTQGMISKWESREYNFTIRSLNEICQKLNMDFSVSIARPGVKGNYEVVKWDKDNAAKKKKSSAWIKGLTDKGAIA